ncbi:cytochrome c family protein [Sphingomonas sp.]|jgi:cytochrome c|uniref:c-type cytochrome n=1 Tax=Sphingomonas sp. TaxID=28214 RepID=UPI002DEB9557|nr:cytochrome c family protein [Sphingomonas sp.]
MRLMMLSLLALTACSKSAEPEQQAPTAETPAAAPKAFAELKGDPAAGEKTYVQCRVCHAVEPNKGGVGPTLHQVVGRAAGSLPGYAYSSAMKQSGLTWHGETLYRFLEVPMAVVPGTKMAYAGMKDPQKRADVIAYLETLK